jgi:4-amino-4-deoxy-L-arabinose transferase-like glycosyltransferase
MSMLQIVFLKIFTHINVPLRIFFIALTATAIVSFFSLAKRLFDPAMALLATLILVFYPPQWFWGSRVNPHMYAMDGAIISVYLLFLGWSRKSLLLPLLIGIFWATIALMRAEFSLGIGVLCLTSLVAYKGSSRGFATALLLLVGFAIGLGPWFARNWRLHHEFVLISTNYGDNVWKAYNPEYQFKGEDIAFPPALLERLKAEPNEVLRANILKDEAKAFILANPGRFVRNLAGNFLTFWRPWLSKKVAETHENIIYIGTYTPIFVLFIGGVFLIPWRNAFWLTIVGILAYKNFINMPFYVIVLFREVVMPFIILIAVLPIERLLRRI